MPNLAVNAGPGTGKTYTATSIPRYLRSTNREIFLSNNPHTEEQRAIWEYVDSDIIPLIVDSKGERRIPTFLYAAYNADMVPEVEPMVPNVKSPYGVDVRTIHGAGYKVLNKKYGYLKINANRGIHIVEKLTGQNFHQMKDRFLWLSTLRYIEKLKDECLPITPENCEAMRGKYDNLANMPIHDKLVEQGKQIISKMGEIDRMIGIEYIDQVWLAMFVAKSPIYDIGIIDECQDLSPSRLLLVQRLCHHLVFVGDPDQAINAFAGADPHAFDKIRAICHKELPLKISFRNPPNIITKANNLMMNRIIPDKGKRVLLKGTKTTPGIEKNVTFGELLTIIHKPLASNLIVCRYNAPLVACALKFFKAQVPCTILGKQLVDSLCYLVKDRKAVNLHDLDQKLDDYEERSCKSVPPHVQDIIRDKIECVRLVMRICEDVEDIPDTLKEMFKVRNKEDHVQLCTLHKSKGKERDNIWILYPPIESHHATSPEQKQQEQNLHYVGITRTKNNLYWIYP
jgi:superfamily I DNA/RNA helicase